MTTPPFVSLAQANRYLLNRQHLLTPCTDPLTAVRDACGLQAQVPSTPALSLRARVAGFQRKDYDHLMGKERSLVRTWAMRHTVHVVPSTLLTRYTRVYTPYRWPEERIRQTLEMLASGPQTRRQLMARAISELEIPQKEAEEMFGPWGGILASLARMALTVHIPATGNDVPFVRVLDWLGREPEPIPVQMLEDALLTDYLRGYGPISIHDFYHFTGFHGIERAKEIFRRATNLAEVRLEGAKQPYFIAEADLNTLLATSEEKMMPVVLLPRFDSLILAYRNKSRILDDDWSRHIFGTGAQVEAFVLINGRVGGAWKITQTTRTLRFHFNPFGNQPADAVEAEAQRLAEWFELERLEFTVRSQGPQAAVAARKERVESHAATLKAPRMKPHDAYIEPVRGGTLVHIPALPGFAVSQERLVESATAYMAWLKAKKIPFSPVSLEQLNIVEIHPDIRTINPRPTQTTQALIDSDLVPITDKDLKSARRILLAASGPVPPHVDHSTYMGWLASRCLGKALSLRTDMSAEKRLDTSINLLLDGIANLDRAARGRVTEKAGEPWTPRKVMRRAIHYLLQRASILDSRT